VTKNANLQQQGVWQNTGLTLVIFNKLLSALSQPTFHCSAFVLNFIISFSTDSYRVGVCSG